MGSLNLQEDNERFCGGGFGGNETTRHVLLLPDGRILAKYHHESDYLEKSGDPRSSKSPNSPSRRCLLPTMGSSGVRMLSSLLI